MAIERRVCDDHSVVGEQQRQRIPGGRRVRQVAAERAAVLDLRGPNRPGRSDERGQIPLHVRRAHDRRVGLRGTDLQCFIHATDAFELRQRPYIEQRRLGDSSARCSAEQNVSAATSAALWHDDYRRRFGMHEVSYLRPQNLADAVQLYPTTSGCRVLAAATRSPMVIAARAHPGVPSPGRCSMYGRCRSSKACRRVNETLEIRCRGVLHGDHALA